jgi:two-component system chemotaxis sensor kinase CheA
MPNLDGFELSQRIKQSSEWAHLPVIALTSLAGSADMQRGIEVGIDDYQIKMDRDKLLNAIQNFTGKNAGNNVPVLQTV